MESYLCATLAKAIVNNRWMAVVFGLIPRTANGFSCAGRALLAVSLAFVMLQSEDAQAGQVLDRIRSKGVMVVATDPVWPPFSWRNASGRFEGFDIEIAEEIARRMEVSIEYATPDWTEITAGNWQGSWDISVGSMTPTAERAKHLDFPIVYYSSPVSVAIHRDNTEIKLPADLSGKRIGILGDTTYELYLRRQPMDVIGMLPYTDKIDNPVILTYTQEDKVFDDLSRGNGVVLDAMLNYLPVLLYEIGRGRPLKIVGAPLFLVPNAIAIEPGDPDLSTLIKKIVTAMREDGTLKAISMKWFNFDMTQP